MFGLFLFTILGLLLAILVAIGLFSVKITQLTIAVLQVICTRIANRAHYIHWWLMLPTFTRTKNCPPYPGRKAAPNPIFTTIRNK